MMARPRLLLPSPQQTPLPPRSRQPSPLLLLPREKQLLSLLRPPLRMQVLPSCRPWREGQGQQTP